VSYPPRPPADRFWRHVQKSDGCWEWTASRNHWGYGQFNAGNKRRVQAHRFSYELAYGVSIPAGSHICHSCDNPSCVNPAHLWLGDNTSNRADMKMKGRGANQNTERTTCKHGHALTGSNVRFYMSRGRQYRACVACVRARSRDHYLRTRGAHDNAA
jgi:hypothetical protein